MLEIYRQISGESEVRVFVFVFCVESRRAPEQRVRPDPIRPSQAIGRKMT